MAIKFLSNETIDGTLVITGDLAINTNKFTVNATSGNTLVAGTLGVTSTLTSADITTGNISAGNGIFSGGINANGTSVTNTFKSTVLINRVGQQSTLLIGSNSIDDVVIGFQTDGNSMSMGIDRSDSNAFKISDSNGGLGTLDRFKIDTSGNAFFTGNLTVDGTTTSTGSSTYNGNVAIKGSLTIGENPYAAGGLLIPAVSGAYDIGSTLLSWNNIHTSSIILSYIEPTLANLTIQINSSTRTTGSVTVIKSIASIAPNTDANNLLLIENTNASGSCNIRLRGGDGATRIMYGKNGGTDKLFITPRNADTSHFILDQVGNATFAGNVGIGITPSASFSGVDVLQLGKGMTIFGNTDNDRASMAANLYLDAATAFRYVMDGYSGRFAIEDGTMLWGLSGLGSAGAVTTVSTKMTLLNNGNLGIGTTSPSRLLTIQDGDGGGTGGSGIDSRTKLLINSNTESYISVNVPALSFCGERYMIAGTTKASVELWDYAAGPQFRIAAIDSRPITFATGNVERMRITAAGALEIKGAGTTLNGNAFITNSNALTLFGSTQSSGVPKDMAFFNGAERMRIKATTGNVGIGTDSPEEKLHVRQDAAGGVNNFILELQNTTTVADSRAGILFSMNSSVGSARDGFAIQGSNNGVDGQGNLTFGSVLNNTFTERMRIDSKGQVGIGAPSLPQNVYTASGGGYAMLGLGQSSFLTAYKADDSIELCQNTYLNTSGVYQGVIANVRGALLTMVDGQFVFATHTTAGDKTQTVLPVMTLSDGGQVGLGRNIGSYKFNLISNSNIQNGAYISAGTGNGNHAFYVENLAGSAEHFAVQGDGQIRMNATRIGNILFGATSISAITSSSPAGSGFGMESNNRSVLFQGTTSTGVMTMQAYYNPNGQVGRIGLNGSTTSYFTSSDYRLKEDLQDFKGLDKVSKISVYDFKWKADESRSYGVIAHELQEVLPQAVSGDKDAKENQMVDYSKIVPLLIKSIQELKAEIELLKKK